MGEYELNLPFEVDDPNEELAWQTIKEHIEEEAAREKTLIINPAVMAKVASLVGVVKQLNEGDNQFSVKLVPDPLTRSIMVSVTFEYFTMNAALIQQFTKALPNCYEVSCGEAFQEGLTNLHFFFKDFYIEIKAD